MNKWVKIRNFIKINNLTNKWIEKIKTFILYRILDFISFKLHENK